MASAPPVRCATRDWEAAMNDHNASQSNALPVLRRPEGDGEWDDRTGPMTVYRGPWGSSASKPEQRTVTLTLPEAALSARLIELAMRTLGTFLTEADRTDALIAVGKLRGEIR